MCIENLDGDYYIPGTQPDGVEGVWREAQDSKDLKRYVSKVVCSGDSWMQWVFMGCNLQESLENAIDTMGTGTPNFLMIFL